MLPKIQIVFVCMKCITIALYSIDDMSNSQMDSMTSYYSKSQNRIVCDFFFFFFGEDVALPWGWSRTNGPVIKSSTPFVGKTRLRPCEVLATVPSSNIAVLRMLAHPNGCPLLLNKPGTVPYINRRPGFPGLGFFSYIRGRSRAATAASLYPTNHLDRNRISIIKILQQRFNNYNGANIVCFVADFLTSQTEYSI